jgi:hypothetical protein
MRNNNQTNREKTKNSSTTSESLSAPINNDTTMMIIDRKISLATEGLQPYIENWLRIRTSDEIASFLNTCCTLCKVHGFWIYIISISLKSSFTYFATGSPS